MGRSIFIGDKPSDMAAGRAAGVGTLLQLDGEANDEGCLTIKQLSQALPYLSSAPR
jgi:D-glycero-D-manno-heptose 1,7-bisphosphate phosphatase